MAYAGLVKRAKSHFEFCNNGPEETPVQGDCSYILTPRATARPSPAGPDCKKIPITIVQVSMYYVHAGCDIEIIFLVLLSETMQLFLV